MTENVTPETVTAVEPQAEKKVTTKPAPKAKGKAKGKAAKAPKAKAKKEAGPRIVADDPTTSPTALARKMIAHGASDDSIMEKVKAAFGPESKKKVLFTSSDLKRLHLRIRLNEKKAEHAKAKAAKKEKAEAAK